MANGINACMFCGTIGRDPEMRGSSGKCLRFSIACNERRKTRDGEWEDHCEWVPVVVLGNRAEALSRILTKGMQVTVLGKYRTSSYEKNGEKKYSTQIVADEVTFSGGQRGGTSERGSSRRQEAAAVEESDDGDIPF